MIHEAEVPDTVNTLVHLLAHKLRNIVVEAVISKALPKTTDDRRSLLISFDFIIL